MNKKYYERETDMKVEDTKFIKEFQKITNDAWLKGWHERNGGNISYRLTKDEVEQIKQEVDENSDWIEIGETLSNLSNEIFLITGSGKFIRNISIHLKENCGLIQIDVTGQQYRIIWGLVAAKPTSELPTHLRSHSVKKELDNEYRVIMHSHTTNIIALTFVLPLEDKVFTRELWEMATECPVVFPDGIGVVDWMVPGGHAIGKETSKLMREYDVVIWAHHGTFAAGKDLDLTFGLMDTVEKSAEILVKVLSMGGKHQTITSDNFKELAKDFNVELPDKFL